MSQMRLEGFVFMTKGKKAVVVQMLGDEKDDKGRRKFDDDLRFVVFTNDLKLVLDGSKRSARLYKSRPYTPNVGK